MGSSYHERFTRKIIEVSLFDKNNKQYFNEAAELLELTFECYKNRGKKQMEKYLNDERIALMAVDNGHLIGFVGATPLYGKTTWELHPLFVKKDCQFQGIGTKLVNALESECKNKGCITVYLGCDDENHSTSLGCTDLYIDTYKKIMNIENLKKHQFEFYQKVGYTIVGVIPDANGLGKPDILMAKRI
jgi:aminoglycoside 6'-N-acetyltransferase I